MFEVIVSIAIAAVVISIGAALVGIVGMILNDMNKMKKGLQ